MGRYKTLALAALASVSSVAVASHAYAAVTLIHGTAVETTQANAENATPATFDSLPGTDPTASFSAPSNPLSFDSRTDPVNGYTLGGFLATGGASGITYTNGAASTDDMNNFGMLIDFTGDVSVTNGQTFTVAHDDGLTLTIGALTVIDVPGPTSPTTTTVTYTGPTGTLPFRLVYGECCGAPAVLNVALPLTAIPEPSTWAMMVLGFAGLGYAGFRTRKTAISIA